MSITDFSNKTIDREYIWHPYSKINPKNYSYCEVTNANGVRIQINNSKWLIDGMSSWWCKVHGYNHPQMNSAINKQLEKFSHVMFGGLTHKPAIELTKKLVGLTPATIDRVFLADSGSVAVEVAIKMAMQYWHAKNLITKTKIVTVLGGYYGDTTGCMSLCDPTTGMHYKFSHILPEHIFVTRPSCKFNETCTDDDFNYMATTLQQNHKYIAAVIIEPIVQGAGGMYFYSPEYLTKLRQLCSELDILLIHDEIATGFGRTGKLFACEHAQVVPDIMCVGKALTGGYMTLAATMCNKDISNVISATGPLMHGPTFMANPLSCAAANCSLEILQTNVWQNQVNNIERYLKIYLSPCKQFNTVKEVRILGAIGVVEMHQPVNVVALQKIFIKQNAWIRPFNNLIYLMPPYIIAENEIKTLCNAIIVALQHNTN